MIYSMTGYASKTLQLPTTTIQLEVKSVNHRFLDLTLKSADDFKSLENNLRAILSQYISRGKVDIRIFFKENQDNGSQLKLNPLLLEQYLKLIKQIKQVENSANLNFDTSINQIISFPGMLIQEHYQLEDIQLPLIAAFEEMLNQFKASQQAEGEKLSEILNLRLTEITSILAVCPQLLAKVSHNYREKLRQRICEVLTDSELNDLRFSQEFAYFCQKIDVSEEIDRLSSHVSEFVKLLKNGGPIGKRLDFICQEMHREANTFASKSVSIETTQKALELKVLIEQIREQVQNIM